jgi:esterase/lipase superfamily enzyme
MDRSASILVALSFIFPFISTESPARAGSIVDTTSIRNIDAAMDKVAPQKTIGTRIKFKNILFITNRQIDYSAEERARRDGLVLPIENVFLKRPAVSFSYGRATISYPANRRRGEQTYRSGSLSQNPLRHFSIVSYEIVPTPNEFANLVTEFHPEIKSHPALIYVHGFDDSFSDAAERLAQLTIDTEYSGSALLFSWPSNDWSGPLPSKHDYERTFQISQASRLYLMHAIGELTNASGASVNVLAHSMGTDIAANAILMRQRLLRDAGFSVPEFTQALVLAAPDISKQEFNDSLRPALILSKMRLVVYCSLDRALALSRAVNQSDDRLGYCTPPVDPMLGVDVVSVKGLIQDFVRHSYYLSATEILDDIEKTFKGIVPTPLPGTVRQIELR